MARKIENRESVEPPKPKEVVVFEAIMEKLETILENAGVYQQIEEEENAKKIKKFPRRKPSPQTLPE